MSLVDEVGGGLVCRICTLGWFRTQAGHSGSGGFSSLLQEKLAWRFAGTSEEHADGSV
jgi:hypothetical protein